MKRYALVGRHGNDGGIYLQSQWRQMKARAWAMVRLNLGPVQVWSSRSEMELAHYDASATQCVTDYIVKARTALEAR